jgi:Niemann-Pick C1 protein
MRWLQERMARMLSSAGVSVTVASLTNFAAFAIGSNTSLPALSAFSLYAAFALLFDLLLQVRLRAAV